MLGDGTYHKNPYAVKTAVKWYKVRDERQSRKWSDRQRQLAGDDDVMQVRGCYYNLPSQNWLG